MIRQNQIRLAQAADADAIAELSREAIEYGLAWGWTPGRVLGCIGDADTNVVIACDGAPMAGFGIMKYGERDAHLLLFAVQAERRRRGVGTALIGWLETTARVAGMQTIRLEARVSNTSGRAFYARHGFEEGTLVRGRYQGVEDGVRYMKRLAGG
ncbi:MAG TPA: GNAT family N-acetyltransferase [Burkholderiaceae bacterium]|nr:GNAT family N-acetyltransferase [Burkholderiaceae bacterium]